MATKKVSRTRSSPARHRGLGFLFWLCLAGIAVAVGVAAREPLKAAFAQLSGKPGTVAAPVREPPRVTVAPLTETEQLQKSRPTVPAAQPDRTPQPNPAEKTPTSQPEKPAMRKARLYFTSVDAAGKIQLKSVIRPIPASDSPLRDTLEALLKGPSAQELNLGLISMIPTDARVRGVTVKGDTAVVDFNESFRFNPQGLDAMAAQLRQVVYAATEFPSVKSVQIRIEGTTVRYLGTEGMRLDAPLSRASFPD
ncbi:MAG: GerMN domain-containing protein [Spirochaetia bacterium]